MQSFVCHRYILSTQITNVHATPLTYPRSLLYLHMHLLTIEVTARLSGFSSCKWHAAVCPENLSPQVLARIGVSVPQIADQDQGSQDLDIQPSSSVPATPSRSHDHVHELSSSFSSNLSSPTVSATSTPISTPTPLLSSLQQKGKNKAQKLSQPNNLTRDRSSKRLQQRADELSKETSSSTDNPLEQQEDLESSPSPSRSKRARK